MSRSRPSLLQAPVKPDSSSGSSLQGMERPVRSFKSFIKTLPPHPPPWPPCDKPLPPTPSPKIRTASRSSSTSRVSLPLRASSVSSWRAPADWSVQTEDTLVAASSIPSGREYSPLLPDIPLDYDRAMEVQTIVNLPSPIAHARLVPIYEQKRSDIEPPRSPPKSPLPLPPRSPARTSVSSAKQDSRKASAASHSSSARKSSGGRPSHVSSNSTSSDLSINSKAFSALGINISPEQSPPLASQDDGVRTDRYYMKGKKMRALNKGDPLADNSWEDADMDEKTRQLSFSQDYHDLLVDQYQEMSVGPEEVLKTAPKDINRDHCRNSQGSNHALPDHELMPRPLSWRQKNSCISSQGDSQTELPLPSINCENEQIAKRRSSDKATAWVPRRLSSATKMPAEARKDSHSTSESYHTFMKKNSKSDNTQSAAEPRKAKKQAAQDLRLSKFFTANKAFRFRRRQPKQLKATDETASHPPPGNIRKAQISAPILQSPTHLLRLPGGIALVKSPSPVVRSEQASIIEPAPLGDQPTQSHPFSHLVGTPDPINSPHVSALSEARTSYTSDLSDPNRVAGRAPSMLPSRFRTSDGSAYSRASSTSSHPLAQELSQSPATHSSVSSTSAWHRLSLGSETALWQTPGFLEKAREKRRRRQRDVRQERLKRSIKVLGPTDPGVVAGYVRGGEVGESGSGAGYLVQGQI